MAGQYLRRSLWRLLCVLPVGLLVFRLARHHWPTWDLLLYLFLVWLVLDVVQLWRMRAIRRGR